MGPLRTAYIEGHEIGGNVRYTNRRTHAAHHTIHEHLRHALEISEDSFPDAFPHIDLPGRLRGTGYTFGAEVFLGIDFGGLVLGLCECVYIICPFAPGARAY